MLHLQPRIHFNEIEIAILEKEFHSSNAEIAKLLQGGCYSRANLCALRGIKSGARCLFPQLLMTSLQ